MKKFLYSVFMLAAVVLAACSNDDNGDTQPKRGMTLNASVEDLSSRATMTDESGTWKFAFAANDQVSVSNSKITNYYTFTNNGSQFTSTDAMVTTEDADWYAYFPGNEVDLTNQTGTFADVANKFAVAGKTAEPTTGEKGLSITLKPKVAVLRVVAVDKKGILDIHVKTTADDKWVKGLTATKNAADFTVVSTSNTKPTLLHKEVQAGEINYVVVPAGVKIAIYNGDMLLNTTKKNEGLTPGKYYTITSGPTKGKTNALINGQETTVEWVQLWAGGPRFATQNVAKEMTWTEAAKTGTDYVWGENWRTPTAAEVTEEGGLQAEWNTKEGKWVVKEGSPTINVTTKDGIEETVEFTGVQPGYTKNTLTLYNKIDSHGYSHFNFWTTTENNGYGCMYRIMIDKGIIGIFGPSSFESKDTKCLVRPVLSIQNITNITNNKK
jgi:major membrane immunogen (membrane-anchored lipoprotein)